MCSNKNNTIHQALSTLLKIPDSRASRAVPRTVEGNRASLKVERSASGPFLQRKKLPMKRPGMSFHRVVFETDIDRLHIDSIKTSVNVDKINYNSCESRIVRIR